MPINEQDILGSAAASLARLEADLAVQRDELLRDGRGPLVYGAQAADRVIDAARKIREIMSTSDQEREQA